MQILTRTPSPRLRLFSLTLLCLRTQLKFLAKLAAMFVKYDDILKLSFVNYRRRRMREKHDRETDEVSLSTVINVF